MVLRVAVRRVVVVTDLRVAADILRVAAALLAADILPVAAALQVGDLRAADRRAAVAMDLQVAVRRAAVVMDLQVVRRAAVVTDLRVAVRRVGALRRVVNRRGLRSSAASFPRLTTARSRWARMYPA